MLDGLFIVSIIGSITQGIKESLEPTIPAENWANKELYYEDSQKLSQKELYRNLKNGKYKETKVYPEPHRDKRGRIIIDDYEAYKKDCDKYGYLQAHKWVKQGKYNMTPEQLKKQEEELKKKWERIYSYI